MTATGVEGIATAAVDAPSGSAVGGRAAGFINVCSALVCGIFRRYTRGDRALLAVGVLGEATVLGVFWYVKRLQRQAMHAAGAAEHRDLNQVVVWHVDGDGAESPRSRSAQTSPTPQSRNNSAAVPGQSAFSGSVTASYGGTPSAAYLSATGHDNAGRDSSPSHPLRSPSIAPPKGFIPFIEHVADLCVQAPSDAVRDGNTSRSALGQSATMSPPPSARSVAAGEGGATPVGPLQCTIGVESVHDGRLILVRIFAAGEEEIDDIIAARVASSRRLLDTVSNVLQPMASVPRERGSRGATRGATSFPSDTGPQSTDDRHPQQLANEPCLSCLSAGSAEPNMGELLRPEALAFAAARRRRDGHRHRDANHSECADRDDGLLWRGRDVFLAGSDWLVSLGDGHSEEPPQRDDPSPIASGSFAAYCGKVEAVTPGAAGDVGVARSRPSADGQSLEIRPLPQQLSNRYLYYPALDVAFEPPPGWIVSEANVEYPIGFVKLMQAHSDDDYPAELRIISEEMYEAISLEGYMGRLRDHLLQAAGANDLTILTPSTPVPPRPFQAQLEYVQCFEIPGSIAQLMWRVAEFVVLPRQGVAYTVQFQCRADLFESLFRSVEVLLRGMLLPVDASYIDIDFFEHELHGGASAVGLSKQQQPVSPRHSSSTAGAHGSSVTSGEPEKFAALSTPLADALSRHSTGSATRGRELSSDNNANSDGALVLDPLIGLRDGPHVVHFTTCTAVNAFPRRTLCLGNDYGGSLYRVLCGAVQLVAGRSRIAASTFGTVGQLMMWLGFGSANDDAVQSMLCARYLALDTRSLLHPMSQQRQFAAELSDSTAYHGSRNGDYPTSTGMMAGAISHVVSHRTVVLPIAVHQPPTLPTQLQRPESFDRDHEPHVAYDCPRYNLSAAVPLRLLHTLHVSTHLPWTPVQPSDTTSDHKSSPLGVSHLLDASPSLDLLCTPTSSNPAESPVPASTKSDSPASPLPHAPPPHLAAVGTHLVTFSHRTALHVSVFHCTPQKTFLQPTSPPPSQQPAGFGANRRRSRTVTPVVESSGGGVGGPLQRGSSLMTDSITSTLTTQSSLHSQQISFALGSGSGAAHTYSWRLVGTPTPFAKPLLRGYSGEFYVCEMTPPLHTSETLPRAPHNGAAEDYSTQAQQPIHRRRRVVALLFLRHRTAVVLHGIDVNFDQSITTLVDPDWDPHHHEAAQHSRRDSFAPPIPDPGLEPSSTATTSMKPRDATQSPGETADAAASAPTTEPPHITVDDSAYNDEHEGQQEPTDLGNLSVFTQLYWLGLDIACSLRRDSAAHRIGHAQSDTQPDVLYCHPSAGFRVRVPLSPSALVVQHRFGNAVAGMRPVSAGELHSGGDAHFDAVLAAPYAQCWVLDSRASSGAGAVTLAEWAQLVTEEVGGQPSHTATTTNSYNFLISQDEGDDGEPTAVNVFLCRLAECRPWRVVQLRWVYAQRAARGIYPLIHAMTSSLQEDNTIITADNERPQRRSRRTMVGPSHMPDNATNDHTTVLTPWQARVWRKSYRPVPATHPHHSSGDDGGGVVNLDAQHQVLSGGSFNEVQYTALRQACFA